MNPRLSITAAVAVLAASLSLNAVISGSGWLLAGIGAITCAAVAGVLTRLSVTKSAVAAGLSALIAIVPMFTASSWYPRVGALLILALVVTCALAGRLRWIASLVTYLAIMLIYLNLAFAHAESVGWIIPTSKSLAALAKLPSEATSQFHYLPPILDPLSVSFFAAAGIGLIAILVDILAVSFRRPAIAGLPLLALFSVPVASNLKNFGLGQSITFAIGLAAFLMLLATDGRERLRIWGRLVSFRYVQSGDEAGPGPDTRDIAASGRRIGLAAVCLAILVPLVLPSLQVRDLFATSGTGSGNGPGGSSGSIGSVSPLLTVQDQLSLTSPQNVLSYTTTAASPQDQYLQVYALNYDAKQNDWQPVMHGYRPVSFGKALPVSVPGLTKGVRAVKVTTDVVVADSQRGNAYLPAPYAPVQLKVNGAGWYEYGGSLTVFSSLTLGGLKYAVTSLEVDPTTAELDTTAPAPAWAVKGYTGYNGPDASKLKQIAVKVAGTGTPFQKATHLQDWFLANFTYSLKPGLPASSGWLLDFLTKHRSGACQQFSWAFAVLARLIGIPTRIATGYTAGTPGSHHTWVVTTRDAHAWPEVFVPRIGWVRLEPTPSGSAGQGTAVVPPYASLGAPPPSVSPIAGNPTGNLGKGSTGRIKPGRNTKLSGLSSGTATSSARRGSGFPWEALIPILLLLALVCPAVARVATRRRRWRAASGDAALAHAAWQEMADDLADYGISRQPSESPRAFVRRIAGEAGLDQAARDAVSRIGAAEERARYAASARPATGLRPDVRTVRQAVAARAPWSQRLRARLFPASTLAAGWRGVQRTGEYLGWLDAPWPTVRRQVRNSVAHRSSS